MRVVEKAGQVLYTWGAALLVLAAPVARGTVSLYVAPGEAQSWTVDLPAGCELRGGTVADVGAPRHGTLTTTGAKIMFRPAASFWSLGLDSFRYSVNRADTQTRCTAWLLGTRRLRTLDLAPGEGRSRVPMTPSGGGSQGAGSGVKIHVPPPPGGGTGGLPEPGVPEASSGGVPEFVVEALEDDSGRRLALETLLFSASTPDGGPALGLWINESPAGVSAWLEAGGQASARVPVEPGVRNLDLEWWQAGVDGSNNGGVLLAIDGRARALLPASLPGVLDYELHAPSLSISTEVTAAELRLEQAVPAVEPLVREDFDGATDSLATSVDWPLKLTTEAGLLDGKGLRIPWSSAVFASWRVDLPAAAESLGVGFWLRSDPNASGRVELLSAYEDDWRTSAPRLRLVADQEFGQSILRVLFDDAGGATYALEAPAIARGLTVRVDVQWRSGYLVKHGEGGRVRLWVDGVLAGEQVGLEFAKGLAIQSLMIGPTVAPTGAGVLDVDGFEVWR